MISYLCVQTQDVQNLNPSNANLSRVRFGQKWWLDYNTDAFDINYVTCPSLFL